MFNLLVTQNGKLNCISHLLFINISEFIRSWSLSSTGHMPPSTAGSTTYMRTTTSEVWDTVVITGMIKH